MRPLSRISFVGPLRGSLLPSDLSMEVLPEIDDDNCLHAGGMSSGLIAYYPFASAATGSSCEALRAGR